MVMLVEIMIVHGGHAGGSCGVHTGGNCGCGGHAGGSCSCGGHAGGSCSGIMLLTMVLVLYLQVLVFVLTGHFFYAQLL